MIFDLSAAVLINESRNPHRAGDIAIFKTIADAEKYLEPIDVLNNEYAAFTLDGQILELDVIGDRVRIRHTRDHGDHCDQIRSLLEAYADAVLTAQKRRGLGATQLSPSKMSIDELVKLIGFSQ